MGDRLFLLHFCTMHICFNGEFFPASTPLLPVQNRSYKWGDGLFETMQVFRGRLLLEDLHMERLFTSLKLLEIEAGEAFTQPALVAQLLQLAQKNNCLPRARMRLAVYRQEDNTAGYSMEALPLPEKTNSWQERGLTLTLYPYARKSTDAFANLKTANYLPYVLAQRYAAEQGADEALVLNTQNFLCDASKANLFFIRDKNLYTPALHQGCVNGVMRRVVLQEAKRIGFRIYQNEVQEEDLLQADEVFLTNAIQQMRWVEAYKGRTYTHTQTRVLFEAVTATIFRGLC